MLLKSDIPHSNSSIYFFLWLSLSFWFSHEVLMVLQQATKRAHPKKSLPVYLKQLHNIYFVKVGCLWRYRCLKFQSHLKMWFSTSIDIMWYPEAAIYAKNLFGSHSIVSWWSFVNDTGEVVEQNWQSVTKLNGVKNAITQVTYFLNGPMFNLLFYCHVIERKWLFMRNLAIILPSKSKLSKKILTFQYYWWKYRNTEK